MGLETRFNTPDLQHLLREAHPSGEWALLFEVAPRTGGGTRYADAIAVNLWKSRGYAVHGFEIKVSRADWLRELKQPEKAEEIFGHCDHFWVVAAPNVVKPDELPAGWGLMEPVVTQTKRVTKMSMPAAVGLVGPETYLPSEPAGPEPSTAEDVAQRHKLKIIVKAAKLKAKPLTREFFASLMRRGHETLEEMADRRFFAERLKISTDTREHIHREVARRTERMDKLEESVEAFKRATGLEIGSWSGPPIEIIDLAKRLYALRGHGQGDQFLGRMNDLVQQIDRAGSQLRDALEGAQLALGDESQPTHVPADHQAPLADQQRSVDA